MRRSASGTFSRLILSAICVTLLLTGCEVEMARRYFEVPPQTKDKAPMFAREPQCDAATIDELKFSSPPANLEKIKYIIPMGALASEHVAPTDHQYYQDFTNNEIDIEVYAPTDGTVINIQHMGNFRGDVEREPSNDYHITIDHGCGISSVFIHVDVMSDKLMSAYVNKTFAVTVEAGEVIGWFDENVDFNVVDESVQILFANPASYAAGQNRAHIKDPFEYYDEPLKSKLIAKSLRRVEPFGGTIDYDINGTLAGVWFQEGTNGWEGLSINSYWAGHLAFVYDKIDVDHVLFSIGRYESIAKQFGVKGNAPDPATVTKKTGITAYELVDFEYLAGDKRWNYDSWSDQLALKNSEYVQGVALVQMLSDSKVKVEVVPGKTAADVKGFTDAARIYVR